MKLKPNVIFWITFLCLFNMGCGTDETVYLEQVVSETETGELDTEYVLESETEMHTLDSETEETSDICYVYICGAVSNPGVYEMPAESRIYEVLCMAGGFTEDASSVSVNQAETVYDGQMIFIPTVTEAEAGIDTDLLSRVVGNSYSGETDMESSDGRVNINTATQSELMTLSGIGQAKAEQIVAYREEHGGFTTVDEIMNVDGIKEGLYNRIKDKIRVK